MASLIYYKYPSSSASLIQHNIISRTLRNWTFRSLLNDLLSNTAEMTQNLFSTTLFACFSQWHLITIKNYFLKDLWEGRKLWKSKLCDDKSDWDRSRLFPGLPMNHILRFRWLPRKIILGITSSKNAWNTLILLTIKFISWFQINLIKKEI